MLFGKVVQSQKTQGFCIADFATLSDETRSRSKIFPLFTWIKEPCVRKFERLERSKLLGISQTKFIFGWARQILGRDRWKIWAKKEKYLIFPGLSKGTCPDSR